MDKSLREPIDELLRQATAPVVIDGDVQGTAWLFSSQGHLLTAGHLLGKDAPRDNVSVRFEKDIPRIAHCLDWAYSAALGLDYAILKLDEVPPGVRPIPIALARSVEGRFRLCGFGKTLHDRSDGSGDFVGALDPQNNRANRLFLLRSPELGEGGYSGAGVFSETLQAAVAIQIEATAKEAGAGRDTVLAMPLYRIADRWDLIKQFADPRATSQSQTVANSPGQMVCSRLGFAGTYNFVSEGHDYDKQSSFVKSTVRDGATFYGLSPDRMIELQSEPEIDNHFGHASAGEWLGRLVIPPSSFQAILKAFVDDLNGRHRSDPAANKFRQQLNAWYLTATRFTNLWVTMEFPGRHQQATVIIAYWNYCPTFIPRDAAITEPTFSVQQAAQVLMGDIYGDIDNLFSAFVFQRGNFDIPENELRKLSFIYFAQCSDSVNDVSSTFTAFSPLYRTLLLAQRPESLAASVMLDRYVLINTRGFIGMTGQPRMAKTPALQLILVHSEIDVDDLELVDLLRRLCAIEKGSAQLNTISEFLLPNAQEQCEHATAGLRKLRGQARQLAVDRDKCFTYPALTVLIERAGLLDEELADNLGLFFGSRRALSYYCTVATRASEFLQATWREVRGKLLLGPHTFVDERKAQTDDIMRTAQAYEQTLNEGYDSLNALLTSIAGCRLSLYQKHVGLQGGSESDTLVTELIFVLMPFRPEFDEIYREIVTPLIDANRDKWLLRCVRADELYGTSSIVHDIWQWIRKARLVIAELSGRNPNVLYELGLCHMLRKPVILLTQSMEDVPFSLQHLRCIVYKLGPGGLRQLRADLQHTIESLLSQNTREVDLFQE